MNANTESLTKNALLGLDSPIARGGELPSWWPGSNPYVIGDCLEIMRKMPDKCVDLVVTSPPYNLNIDYGKTTNDGKPIDEYYVWCNSWISEVARILKGGGRFCLQIGCFQPSINELTYASFTNICQSKGLVFRDFVIWDKSNIPSRTAWGSWKSPSNPRMLPPFEMVINFHKETPNMQHKGTSDLTSDEFVSWTNALWKISCERDRQHPAPFPSELAERLIKLNTYPSDIVFDPFLGSGTTLLSCRKKGRVGIGCEINPEYEGIIRKRAMLDISGLDQYATPSNRKGGVSCPTNQSEQLTQVTLVGKGDS